MQIGQGRYGLYGLICKLEKEDMDFMGNMQIGKGR